MRALGAVLQPDNSCQFRIWAPLCRDVHLHIIAPRERLVRMQPREFGYHQIRLPDVEAGTRYMYRLESGREFPDPASRYQPTGVHNASEVINPAFPWRDQTWHGTPLERYIIYELHVGTFTPEGTFDAVIPHIPYLAELGITAIELMPIAQFSGSRNWGYDGVYLFAPQNNYGGPDGLKRLVDACHAQNVAVILDVVYNHVGPEGNYLSEFGPYFTTRYQTPWGSALNFDDAYSDPVRTFFIQNARYWVNEFHIDGLRLDAVHAIMDHSAMNFLEELTEQVHQDGLQLNRLVHVIAESALNDVRLIRPPELGGYGLDGQWNDDFHHALHTLLTKESSGYYVDFGKFKQMAQAFSEGFVYTGHFSTNRARRHGNSSRGVPPSRFVVYAQNHDQIGNRMYGERLSQLVSVDSFKLAEATVLLSPFIPLLFMGDEYGEKAPFQYFVSHEDTSLVEAVREGRKEEFASFKWAGEPPDPQDENTFRSCRLEHQLREQNGHRMLLEYHKELIRLRKALPALRHLSKEHMDVRAVENLHVLIVRRWNDDNEVVVLLNFSDNTEGVDPSLPPGIWRKLLDSADSRWLGPGTAVPDVLEAEERATLEIAPKAVVLFAKEIND